MSSYFDNQISLEIQVLQRLAAVGGTYVGKNTAGQLYSCRAGLELVAKDFIAIIWQLHRSGYLNKRPLKSYWPDSKPGEPTYKTFTYYYLSDSGRELLKEFGPC